MSGTTTRARGRRRSSDHEEEHANHERWLLTYADMITLLMVLFIVLFAISEVNQKKFDELGHGLSQSFGDAHVVDGGAGVLEGSQQQSDVEEDAIAVQQAVARQEQDVLAQRAIDDQFVKLRAEITRALRVRGLSGSVQFDRQERGLVIDVVTDKVLFDLGSADLREQGRGVLDAIGPSLARVGNTLSVEGNTDNIPISGGAFPSNWELSTERATTVLRYLLTKGVRPSRVSAAGYADQRPLVPNDTPAHRARNRRVAIVVLNPATPTPALTSSVVAPSAARIAPPVAGGH
jgi:chemotaxis protein MotB